MQIGFMGAGAMENVMMPRLLVAGHVTHVGNRNLGRIRVLSERRRGGGQLRADVLVQRSRMLPSSIDQATPGGELSQAWMPRRCRA